MSLLCRNHREGVTDSMRRMVQCDTAEPLGAGVTMSRKMRLLGAATHGSSKSKGQYGPTRFLRLNATCR